ncbi:MAG: hypothetical protein GX089_10450 [Fibrobacter sp.]|nr:hypothetical protein [Fibrobacter sp.]
MIVYRNYRQPVPVKECSSRIRKIIGRIRGQLYPDYQDVISLLIECGELETGITDFLFPDRDSIFSARTEMLRKLSLIAGRVVCRLWERQKLDRGEIDKAEEMLSEIESWEIRSILLSVPEGFAYYSLYPEAYIEAACRFRGRISTESVLVIGLRSIGTSLSSLVSAQLELMGCSVKSFTLRPRGHPFSRSAQIDKETEEYISGCKNSFIAVVDEGPGLSGSSLGGTLEMLRGIGLTEERTVIFPSWIPDSNRFINRNARELWPRYRKFVGSFDQLWVESGRLQSSFGMKIERDLSAGMWRYLHYSSEKDYPGVHHHHERRKYLLRGDNTYFLAKFAGLGRYGIDLAERAEKFTGNGFCPAVEKISDGFVVMEYLDGRPVRPDDVNDKFLERAASYCAFIRNHFPSSLTVTLDEMQEMILENVREGIGVEWCKRVESACDAAVEYYGMEPVEIDGRMMPHEWILTDKGIFKTDHLEHHSDQFFHGSQNIAWDIAGFCEEFGLSRQQRDVFTEMYMGKTGDTLLRKRLPFFTVAYLAFHLGYVSLAVDSLRGSDDCGRFEKLKNRYKERLQEMLLNY